MSELNLDFSILIETENNVTRSYCGYQSASGDTPQSGAPDESEKRTRNFIAMEVDGASSDVNTFDGVWAGAVDRPQWKFSSGEIYSKIQNMPSCSYVDEPWHPSSSLVHTSSGYFANELGMGIH